MYLDMSESDYDGRWNQHSQWFALWAFQLPYLIISRCRPWINFLDFACWVLYLRGFLADIVSFFTVQVAEFLKVNAQKGLFFFDSSYRPVPLAQQYIGISEHNYLARTELLNEICYKKVFSIYPSR